MPRINVYLNDERAEEYVILRAHGWSASQAFGELVDLSYDSLEEDLEKYGEPIHMATPRISRLVEEIA